MSYDETHPKNVYRYCYDCKCHYLRRDEISHFEKHNRFRPVPLDGDGEVDDYLALVEVMKLMNKTKGELNHIIRTGQVDVKRVPNGQRHRTFVTKKSLLAYAEKAMRNGDIRLMETLANLKPKRRQNYMEMPRKPNVD